MDRATKEGEGTWWVGRNENLGLGPGSKAGPDI